MAQRFGPQGQTPACKLVRDYVRALHTTYLDHVRHLRPGERGALPLVAAREVTVLAAAARQLHLVATTQPLPAPSGAEVVLADEHAGVAWDVRFYDPSVLPALGMLGDDDPVAVRRVLGISDVVYHLTVGVGGGLSGHHAQHSGVALANQHAQVSRDLDRVRHALPHREASLDELAVCVRKGLHRAAGLLAGDLTGGRVAPPADTQAPAVLAALVLDLCQDVSR